jgi:hypothetical protein
MVSPRPHSFSADIRIAGVLIAFLVAALAMAMVLTYVIDAESLVATLVAWISILIGTTAMARMIAALLGRQ